MSAANLVDYGFQSFDDLPVKPELLRGITAFGLRKPSKVHQHGVIPIIRGRDCILLASPGIHRMTTLCIGVLQRVDLSIRGAQAIILANTDADAREFRSITDALCHNDSKVSEDSTMKLSPTQVLIGTDAFIHEMIIQQGAERDAIKIYCVDNGEMAFSRHPSGNMDVMSLSPSLEAIHDWLPTDVQMVVALSTITDDVVEVVSQVMNHPMTIIVHDEEAQDDDA